MKRVTNAKRSALAVFAVLAVMLAGSAPSQAQGVRGHGFGGGHGGGTVEHHGFDGHHFGGRDFDHHHFEGRRFGFGFGFGPVFPYYPPYVELPSYWYYCPSYQAYYPNVTSCPEPWVTVPAG